jgi:uncharacterized ferredoxin-like protein
VTAMTTVADLMAIAARTAPKTKGQDFVVIEIVEGEAVRALGQAMIERGRRSGVAGFERDGKNVLSSDVVVLIGIKDAPPAGLNCGACGNEKCLRINTSEMEFKGPQCPYRVLDMGIALGSAVKIASLMNVDNRIMYRVGTAGREAKLIDADFVMGVPLSATGKSPYFDR